MSENVLVLGATSGIARALVRVMADRGCRMVLAGRSNEDLERMANDAKIRSGAAIFVEPFEALDFDSHPDFYQRARAHLSQHIDGVILCYGYMTEQEKTQRDFDEARRTIDINFTSAVSILEIAAQDLEHQRTGYIAAISSVAGDRGRQSNYTYGASKAALTTYLQGLRNRLHHSGVSVLTIKPGFVFTSMTEGLLDPGSPMVAAPQTVAKHIDRAIRGRRDLIYTPWFWSGIMSVIGAIPESIFKRLKL